MTNYSLDFSRPSSQLIFDSGLRWRIGCTKTVHITCSESNVWSFYYKYQYGGQPHLLHQLKWITTVRISSTNSNNRYLLLATASTNASPTFRFFKNTSLQRLYSIQTGAKDHFRVPEDIWLAFNTHLNGENIFPDETPRVTAEEKCEICVVLEVEGMSFSMIENWPWID